MHRQRGRPSGLASGAAPTLGAAWPTARARHSSFGRSGLRYALNSRSFGPHRPQAQVGGHRALPRAGTAGPAGGVNSCSSSAPSGPRSRRRRRRRGPRRRGCWSRSWHRGRRRRRRPEAAAHAALGLARAARGERNPRTAARMRDRVMDRLQANFPENRNHVFQS